MVTLAVAFLVPWSITVTCGCAVQKRLVLNVCCGFKALRFVPSVTSWLMKDTFDAMMSRFDERRSTIAGPSIFTPSTAFDGNVKAISAGTSLYGGTDCTLTIVIVNCDR